MAAQNAYAAMTKEHFKQPASKQAAAVKRDSNSSSQQQQKQSFVDHQATEQHQMQTKFNVYNIRYRLLAEEIRTTVQDILKPQVLQTIRLGQEIQLDMMRLKEENHKFTQSIESMKNQQRLEDNGIKMLIHQIP